MPPIIPPPPPTPIPGEGELVMSEWAIVIGGCILLSSIWLGVLIYDLHRRYQAVQRDGETKKKDKKRRKRE